MTIHAALSVLSTAHINLCAKRVSNAKEVARKRKALQSKIRNKIRDIEEALERDAPENIQQSIKMVGTNLAAGNDVLAWIRKNDGGDVVTDYPELDSDFHQGLTLLRRRLQLSGKMSDMSGGGKTPVVEESGKTKNPNIPPTPSHFSQLVHQKFWDSALQISEAWWVRRDLIDSFEHIYPDQEVPDEHRFTKWLTAMKNSKAITTSGKGKRLEYQVVRA